MPIYAYRCDACGRDSELLQKVSAPAPACPHCSATKMVKQLTAAGFQLKGSGYYATDFKTPAATSSASSSENPSTTPSAASSESKAKTDTSSCGGSCVCH